MVSKAIRFVIGLKLNLREKPELGHSDGVKRACDTKTSRVVHIGVRLSNQPSLSHPESFLCPSDQPDAGIASLRCSLRRYPPPSAEAGRCTSRCRRIDCRSIQAGDNPLLARASAAVRSPHTVCAFWPA